MKEIYADKDQIHSYLALRKAVGWIGILLPFVLVLGHTIIFGGDTLLQNISAYYHTGMHDLFVGAICAIALFLFFYRGYDRWDNIAANLAGFLALAIAFFPTVKEGAYDYIEKNFYIEEFTLTIRNALESNGRMRDDAKFLRDMENAVSFGEIIGKSREMLKVYSLIKKVAETTANVLILGESGTGKELVAKAIHANSPRKEKPFVAINCGGIPENLLESELFGYQKGSFTGAYADKPGLFEIARGGTIFLDEVAELPPVLQVKLLRVVQEKTFLRIGGTENIRVDVRIISATNRNLEEMIRNGGFREDLYYRLNVIPVRIPPLRERKEDIAILTKFFIEKYAREFGKGIKNISSYGLELLMEYSFPGNVRELENIIERSVALEQSNIVLPENLVISGGKSAQQADSFHSGAFPEQGLSLNEEVANFERNLIENALEKAHGSKTKAAELLQVSFDSLRYRIEKLAM